MAARKLAQIQEYNLGFWAIRTWAHSYAVLYHTSTLPL